jgi:hypothetical protein
MGSLPPSYKLIILFCAWILFVSPSLAAGMNISHDVSGPATLNLSNEARVPVHAGRIWRESTSFAPFGPRDDVRMADFDGKMWVVGGDFLNEDLNDVWYSSDGTTWDLANSSAPFTPRTRHGLLSFNGRLWVIGGLGHEGIFNRAEKAYNDVWYSSDGIIWTEATASAAFPPRCQHTAVVYGGRMWIIGGRGIRDGKNPAIQYNDVWYSTDGATWIQATAHAGFSPRDVHGSVAFDNSLWVIGSQNDNEVWRSQDGVAWTLVAKSPFSFAPKMIDRPPIFLVFDGKIWMVTEFSGGHPGNSDVWYTADGKTWALVNTDRTPYSGPEINHQGGVVFDNRMWVTGVYLEESYDPGSSTNLARAYRHRFRNALWYSGLDSGSYTDLDATPVETAVPAGTDEGGQGIISALMRQFLRFFFGSS